MRRRVLGLQRRALSSRGGGVLGHEAPDSAAGERRAPTGREERIIGPATALLQLDPEESDGVFVEGCAPFLSSLAGAADVGAGAQFHVGAPQSGELGDSHAGLDLHAEGGGARGSVMSSSLGASPGLPGTNWHSSRQASRCAATVFGLTRRWPMRRWVK